MATVYRATVVGSHWNGWQLSFEQGESLVLEGQQFVRAEYGSTLHAFDERWHYRREDAATACIPELRKNQKMLEDLIQEIQAADTSRSGCHFTAIV